MKTSFLILSDTHDLDLGTSKDFAFRSPTPTADVILHCGDLTTNGGLESHQKAIDMLSSMPAELKLVIPGNHDVDLDRDFFNRQGGDPAQHTAALALWRSAATRARGIHLLDEGTHTFTLRSGARFTLHASPWTPRHGESAFQYPSRADRFNRTGTPAWADCVATPPSSIPDFPAVDILMTRGPARAVYGEAEADEGDGDDGMEMLAPEFVGRNQCKKKGYASVDLEGVRHGEQTVFVNAAIIDDEGEPTNAPWLVYLDLPMVQHQQQHPLAR
ncbi:hypothetical protein MBLNU459_g5080t1 [Dothideomycetes sp. NU459]